MEAITNEKVLALYRAVWEMIQEGQNVYQMKVIDITNRAGIGKGTAYEYFRSKEEIVARALQYQSNLEYEMLKKKLSEQKSFRDGFEVCFDWLDKYQNRMEGLIQLLKNMSPTSAGIKEGLACMEANMPEGTERVHLLLKILVQLGKKEGVIMERIPDDFAGLQILSQMMGYFSCTRFSTELDEEKKKQIRRFLYDAIQNGLKERA